MKFVVKILTILTLVLVHSANSQTKETKQLIVYGDATIRVQTNIAFFTFAFKGVGQTLEVAVNNSKEKIKVITNELKKLGLLDKNFSTSYFYSGENQGDKAFLSSTRDYKAEIKVTVTLDSLALLEKAIITVSENEPDFISDVSFTIKDYSNFVMNCLEKAGTSAKERAENLAKQLGFQLGKPIFVEDIGNAMGANANGTYVRGGRQGEVAYILDGVPKEKSGTSFYSPETLIISRVKVIYQIE